MIKEKLIASAYHLFISTLVITPFLLIVYFIWYPNGYADLSGLSEILLLLIAIDLILGPILTFIVFKKGKKTLKFDLAAIVVFQLVAFSYGAFTIHKGHPTYVVVAGDRVELVTADQASPSRSSLEEFKVSTFGYPKLAFAKFPDDVAERNKLLFSNDIETYPEHYRPVINHFEEIIRKSLDPELVFDEPQNKTTLSSFLSKKSLSKDDLIFLPLIGKRKDATIAINRHTGDISGTFDVDPWIN
jgi:hypothetical protein